MRNTLQDGARQLRCRRGIHESRGHTRAANGPGRTSQLAHTRPYDVRTCPFDLHTTALAPFRAPLRSVALRAPAACGRAFAFASMPPLRPLQLLLSLPEGAARALWKAALWGRTFATATQPAATAAHTEADTSYDVIVVGGGIAGSCTAYELQKRGLRVALLEQHDFLHRRGSRCAALRIRACFGHVCSAQRSTPAAC